ncbi:MAG: Peptide chain release factor 2 [Microgenomates group bacterium GW2011_GWC2_46_7]|nr:MAG: Peptide chain release factor 2 [Microgenomates group bacterium GW2011_GWC2_46_7]
MEELVRRLDNLYSKLNIEEKKKRVKDLTEDSLRSDFWSDSSAAGKKMTELAKLKEELEKIEMLNLYKEEGDWQELEKGLNELEFLVYLSGPYGTEAMDWAGMLKRMYTMYFELKGWKPVVVDETPGEEAGIKSTVMEVAGRFAYGFLKGEAGVHRLVRQSPFNADQKRETSFALVEILPELEELDLPNVQIKEEDLEWQFFRASAQGGQNVQKVSTAVRVKHKPTNVVVTAQAERFQEQNRKIAINLLRGRLWALEQKKKEEKIEEIKGDYRPASWGNQIRSYVLHPYKMVKDLRTNIESSNPDAVLDGDLDEFIEKEDILVVG